MKSNQTKYSNLTFPKLNNKSSNPSQIQLSEQIKIQSCIDPKHLYCHIFPYYSFKTKQKSDIKQYNIYAIPSGLTILTYNILLSGHNKQNRFQCIIKLLQFSNADFICLQQVTKPFMQLLYNLDSNTWARDYYMSAVPMGRYHDTLILSKYRCKYYRIPFSNHKSDQNRTMLLAQLFITQNKNTQKMQSIVIGCMHYESDMGNDTARQLQVQKVQDIVNQCNTVVICGDFNFSYCPTVSKQYIDVWLYTCKGDAQRQKQGFTMETTPNNWRPDHILYKSAPKVDLSKLVVHKFGDFTIPPYQNEQVSDVKKDHIVRSPSDHYGLIAYIPLV